jgi:hypothetical protein
VTRLWEASRASFWIDCSSTLQAPVSFESEGKWDVFTKEAEDPRNVLSHSNSIAFGSWVDVAKLIENMENYLSQLETDHPADSSP